MTTSVIIISVLFKTTTSGPHKMRRRAVFRPRALSLTCDSDGRDTFPLSRPPLLQCSTTATVRTSVHLARTSPRSGAWANTRYDVFHRADTSHCFTMTPRDLRDHYFIPPHPLTATQQHPLSPARHFLRPGVQQDAAVPNPPMQTDLPPGRLPDGGQLPAALHAASSRLRPPVCRSLS